MGRAAQPAQQLLDQVVGGLGRRHRLGPLWRRHAEQIRPHPGGQRLQRAVDRSFGTHLVEQLDRLGLPRCRRQPGHGQQQGLAPVSVQRQQRAAAPRAGQVAKACQVEHRPGALVLVTKAHQGIGGGDQQGHARRRFIGHRRCQRAGQRVAQRGQVLQRGLVGLLPSGVGHQRHQGRGGRVAGRRVGRDHGLRALVRQPAPGIGAPFGGPVGPVVGQQLVQRGSTGELVEQVTAQHVVQPQQAGVSVVVQQRERVEPLGDQIAAVVLVQRGGQPPQLGGLCQRDRQVLRKHGQLGIALPLGWFQQCQAGFDGGGHRLVALQHVAVGVEGGHAVVAQVVADGVQRGVDRQALAQVFTQAAVGQAQQHRPMAQLTSQHGQPRLGAHRQAQAQQLHCVGRVHRAQVDGAGAIGQGGRLAGGDQARTPGAGIQQGLDVGLVPDIVDDQQHLPPGQRGLQLRTGAVQGRAAVALARERADQRGQALTGITGVGADRRPQDAVAAGLAHGGVGTKQPGQGGLANTAKTVQADRDRLQRTVAIDEAAPQRCQVGIARHMVGGRWRGLERWRRPRPWAQGGQLDAADVDAAGRHRHGARALGDRPATAQPRLVDRRVGRVGTGMREAELDEAARGQPVELLAEMQVQAVDRGVSGLVVAQRLEPILECDQAGLVGCIGGACGVGRGAGLLVVGQQKGLAAGLERAERGLELFECVTAHFGVEQHHEQLALRDGEVVFVLQAAGRHQVEKVLPGHHLQQHAVVQPGVVACGDSQFEFIAVGPQFGRRRQEDLDCAHGLFSAVATAAVAGC